MPTPSLRDWLQAPAPPAATKALRPESNFHDHNLSVESAPASDRFNPRKRVYSALTGTTLGVQQLLSALRSKAPGSGTDSHWEQSRHFVGITYVALRVICDQAAASEVEVYLQDASVPEGKIPCKPDDPCRRVIENPNDEDSTDDLLYMAALQMGLTGTSLTFANPNSFGRPVELFPISTALTSPLPISMPLYPNGAYRVQAYYPYGPMASFSSPQGAGGAVVAAEQMMRVKNPHPLLRWDGYSPLSAIKLQEDTVEAIDRARFNGQARGVDPSAVMEFDKEADNPGPDDIARIQAEFEALFSGPDNAGRLLIALPGTKVNPFSTSPVDMAWENGWSQLTSFLLAAWGVTKPVAGMLDEASYATLYAALKQFHLLTLVPLLRRIAKRWTKYMSQAFEAPYVIEIRPPKIDDQELLERSLATDCALGVRTRNEVRVLRGLPETKEPWGKTIAGQPVPQEQPADQGAVAGPDVLDDLLGGGADEHAGTAGNERPLVESPEVESTRPGNPLANGSLAPRKSLSGADGHGRSLRMSGLRRKPVLKTSVLVPMAKTFLQER